MFQKKIEKNKKYLIYDLRYILLADFTMNIVDNFIYDGMRENVDYIKKLFDNDFEYNSIWKEKYFETTKSTRIFNCIFLTICILFTYFLRYIWIR